MSALSDPVMLTLCIASAEQMLCLKTELPVRPNLEVNPRLR